MKTGSIVKGKYIIGIFESMHDSNCKVRFVKSGDNSYLFSGGIIELKDLKIPTKKEKEEYKRFLLNRGYSYYRGKVTKEL